MSATTTSQYPAASDNSAAAATANAGAIQPTSQPADATAPQHKRVYQACIPCRRRKVKCDLGSVDNPGDPPCVRCRRESKECFFSATRRKRKLDEGGEDSLDGYEYGDDYVVRNGRKMAHTSSPAIGARPSSMGGPLPRSNSSYNENSSGIQGAPLTPGGSIGRLQPLRRPMQDKDDRDGKDDTNTQLENLEAQEVMRREVYGPHDALDLLYKAATNR